MTHEPLICTCRRCGDQRPLAEIILSSIDDQSMLAAVQSAASLHPALADPAIRYMRLFGGIRAATYAKLLSDLATGITGGVFTFRRVEYRASRSLWQSALAETLSSTTVRLPLRAANGHNFLYAVMAAKIAVADKPQPTQIIPPPPSGISDDIDRREALADLAHWERLHRACPGDAAISQRLESARERLSLLSTHV